MYVHTCEQIYMLHIYCGTWSGSPQSHFIAGRIIDGVYHVIVLYAVTQVHTTQLHRVEMDKPTEAALEQLEDEDNNSSTGLY